LKKNKILHIQLLPLLSGVQNMMLNLLTALDSEKYEIFVISKPGGPLVDKVIELGFHYIPVSTLRRNISVFDILAFFDILRICQKYQFDIVHTHSSKTGFIGRIAARIVGVKKIIHTIHGFAFHQFQPKFIQYFYIFMEWISAKFCDKIVFVNNADREYAIKNKLISRKKAVTIFNGIEIPKVQRKKVFREFRDFFIIGSVSRFSKQKNIINLINIAIKVCKKNRKIKFVFIGDGEQYSICQKLVKEAEMETRILLKGWLLNVIEWLQNFDAFILFSKWEGLPISILEAMSVGLPIIASDIKGNNELVSEENGILVPVNDTVELEKILSVLHQRKDDLIRWGENSRKIVDKKFNFNIFVKSYENLYNKK